MSFSKNHNLDKPKSHLVLGTLYPRFRKISAVKGAAWGTEWPLFTF